MSAEILDLRILLESEEKQHKINGSILRDLGLEDEELTKINGSERTFVSYESKPDTIIVKQNGVTEYKPDMSGLKKISYVLNAENKAMTAGDIIEAIYNRDCAAAV